MGAEFLSCRESSIQEREVVNLSSLAHFSTPALENDRISRSNPSRGWSNQEQVPFCKTDLGSEKYSLLFQCFLGWVGDGVGGRYIKLSHIWYLVPTAFMFNSWWLSETRPSELKESKPFPWPVQPESLPCTRNAHNGKLSMVEHGAHRDFTRLRLSEFTIWAFSVLHVRQSELFIRRRIHLPVFLTPKHPRETILDDPVYYSARWNTCLGNWMGPDHLGLKGVLAHLTIALLVHFKQI